MPKNWPVPGPRLGDPPSKASKARGVKRLLSPVVRLTPPPPLGSSNTPPGSDVDRPRPPHGHHHLPGTPTETKETCPTTGLLCMYVYVWRGGCNHSLVGGGKPQCDDYDPRPGGIAPESEFCSGGGRGAHPFQADAAPFFCATDNPKFFLVSGAGDRIKSWGGSPSHEAAQTVMTRAIFFCNASWPP